MSQILNKVRDVDVNDSEAVKEVLAAFFQNLLKYKDIDCNRWLRALENIINRFPKFCGTHRPTIESYLTHFLTSKNYYNVIEAAKCVHSVQQVRPAQEKAATAKTCWRDQMIALCDAAHKLTDALFDRNADIYSNQKNPKSTSQALSSTSLQDALNEIDSVSGSQEVVNKTSILCTRLRNVLVFIQAMLVEIYPVAKPIQPQLILEVILQALSAPGTEDSANVTTIKIQALRTLDALIACLGSNLIPFSALVFRFVMQTLKWSSEHPSEETSKIRITAYNSLARWLVCLRAYRCDVSSATWQDELAAHVARDVTHTKHIMQLTVNAQPMKNLSKKARKRLANTMLKESSISLHMPGEKNKVQLSEKSNDEVSVAALECVETFLYVCGIFLKTTTHKQVQELVVRECFAIQDHTIDRTMGLLRALEACRKNCSIKVPSPTQYCLQLYSVLINSPEREVSKFCSQALLDIRLHLHCSPASLSFALEEHSTQKQKEKEEGRKKVSERNRAVLEKLLGVDWMNPVDPSDDPVITIIDEPPTKRTRVETEVEITENVSISSDSVHSIEINSDSDDESIIEGVELVFDNRADELNLLVVDSDIHNAATQVSNANELETPSELIALELNSEPIELDVTDGQRIENVKGIENLAIHDAPTQVVPNPILVKDVDEHVQEINKVANKDDAEVEKIMDTSISQIDISEAKTQLPQPNSDAIDGKSPLSMEVAYDYPNTGKETVTVLEKMDDENLPSTNDTDDIQITCGQIVKSSQDIDADKNLETPDKALEVPKVNGIDTQTNGDAAVESDDAVTSKIATKDAVITVEDMLADFVDEVNEETQA